MNRAVRSAGAQPLPRPLVLLWAAAASLVLALLPAGAANAQESSADIEPIGTATVCPPVGEIVDDAFPDDDGSVHERAINCAEQYELVRGFEDDTYGPARPITRAQWASIVVREIETALGEELAAGDDAFGDDDGSVHEDAIDKLAAAGIVQGTEDGDFEPAATVTRGQAASFVTGAIDYHDDRDATNDSVLPTDPGDFFTDDDGTEHEQSINQLASQGITQGVVADQYAPNRPVTRGQMASFIMRTAEFAAQNGLWAPPTIEARYYADITALNDSGVMAAATLLAGSDGSLTVVVAAEGVEAGQIHPQHIHGLADASTNATCPGPDSADQLADIPEEADNPDDYVGLEEGADEYGPVQLALNMADDSFPTPDNDAYVYSRTFGADELDGLALNTLTNRAIVLHGLTVDNDTYVPTLPVACGQVAPA